MRDCHVKLGNLSRADGSALYTEGETVMQVAVWGPADLPQSREIPENATVEVIFKHAAASKVETPEGEAVEDFVLDTLESVICTELHPRSLITIVVQEMDSDGILESTAINACIFALLNASVAMSSTIVATTLAIHDETNEVIINPTATELEDCTTWFTFVLDNVDQSVISMNSSGRYKKKTFFKCLDIAKEEAKRLFHFQRTTLSALNS